MTERVTERITYGQEGWVCKKCAGDVTAKAHRSDCPQWKPPAGGGRRRKDRKPTSAKGTGAYVGPLTKMVGTMGTMLYTAGAAKQSPALAYDGQVILAGAEDWARAMQALADENPKVARVLDVVVTTSAWSEVVAATAAMVVPIMAAHRLVPAQSTLIFGVAQPPEPVIDVDMNGHGTPEGGGDGEASRVRVAQGDLAGWGDTAEGDGGGSIPPMG